MHDVTIQIATAADVPPIHALVESAYRGESAKQGWTHEADLLGGQRIDQARLQEMIADPSQVVLIAHAGQGLAGCVNVATTPGPSAYLGMLAVSPTLQAAGLGKRLITAAESLAKQRWQATAMRMTVIKSRGELIDFYLRRGYQLTGQEEPFPLEDVRFGLPKTQDLVFVVLEKPL
jgi:ribosomal protein S18 acetylase RimI-like enzyme